MYLLIAGLFLLPHVHAQPVKAWVFFTDKDTAGFRMENYFDVRVIENRRLQNLPAFDWYDVPVNEKYQKEITGLSDSVLVVSRWFNGMAVWIQQNKLKYISQLPYVKSVEEVVTHPHGGICAQQELYSERLLESSQRLLIGQTTHLKGKKFKSKGIDGTGIRVAVIDAGFKGFSKSRSLQHLRISGRIVYTYDYIRKSKDIDHGSHHGTGVLSCMAGIFDTTSMGLAPQAGYLLYRTEKMFNEKFNEEEYWLAAAEDAEKRGVRIINTSLGYTGRRYFRRDMDGQQSLLSKAARMAARKGILVVCSAGNDGDSPWRIIATPADTDSVLTVGGINPWTGVHASWSSVGPSHDKRVKPNVCAYGYAMGDYGHGGLSELSGTSFSSPLVAGFAVCVLQLHPEYTVSKMISEIEKSAHLYPYFDYSHGYGVPSAVYFTDTLKKEIVPTFKIKEHGDSLTVYIYDECFKPAYISVPEYFGVHNQIRRSAEPDKNSFHVNENNFNSHSSIINTSDPGYFYYGLMNENNYLDWYYVLNVRKQNVVTVSKAHINGLKNFVFHYRGYTVQWPKR
jgi:hypothetical protein